MNTFLLVSMLELSDFFFGNEGGPRHIAQSCRVPSLAIYPPRVNMRRWLPSRDPRYQGITPRDLFPELENEALPENELFDKLTVEHVWERLEPMLDEVFIRKTKL